MIDLQILNKFKSNNQCIDDAILIKLEMAVHLAVVGGVFDGVLF